MKQSIKKEIFSKTFEGDLAEIRFSDLPKDIEGSDIIDIQRVESYYSENNSYDAYSILLVYRITEETDDEYKKRLLRNEDYKERMKKLRYEEYLKLKKEFE
jgi:hypothetical protein